MGAMASQLTGVSIIYSTVCSSADQRKYPSSASLAFVKGIHRWPVNCPKSVTESVSIWWRHPDTCAWTIVQVELSCVSVCLCCSHGRSRPCFNFDKASYGKVPQSLQAARLDLELCDRSEIWQAHRQHCCWYACQISWRYYDLNYWSREFTRSYGKTSYRILKQGIGFASDSFDSVQ